MNWSEIIKLLLPIIIGIIGNKQASGEVSSAADLMACWSSPTGSIQFAAELCRQGVSKGVITPRQQLDVLIALAEVGDHVLFPLFVEKLHELAQTDA